MRYLRCDQQPHPKMAVDNANLASELVFTHHMGPIEPTALGGFNYVMKVSDQHPRWNVILLLKTFKAMPLATVFVQGVVIPVALRVQRIRVDGETEFTAQESD